MPSIRRLTLAEQTANQLRESVRTGRWKEGLPGVRRLALECGISRDTARAALKLLEAEGNICPQGAGRRRIVSGAGRAPTRSLRVGVLSHLSMLEQNAEMQRTLLSLQHEIEASGHIWILAKKTQAELGDDPARLVELIEATQADVWLIIAPSRHLLSWFSIQPFPCISFGGASDEYPMANAGVDAVPPIRNVVRHLLSLGHRRIVLITPPQWRQPAPSRILHAYHEELAAGGIEPGEFHAPAWEQTATGLHALLDSLFRLTPPTALLVVEPPRVLAVLHFLNQRRLRVPQEVSLVCLGQDSMFRWCSPPLAHLHYDLQQPARRIVKWINAVASGQMDRSGTLFPAEFVPGGSIGPAPKMA